MLKHLLIDISQDIVTNSEEITAFSVYLLVSNTINWQGEALHYLFNIGSAIVSGYIVHKLKKFWDKKEKRTPKKPRL
jgi:putative flippase GtrA